MAFLAERVVYASAGVMKVPMKSKNSRPIAPDTTYAVPPVAAGCEVASHGRSKRTRINSAKTPMLRERATYPHEARHAKLGPNGRSSHARRYQSLSAPT